MPLNFEGHLRVSEGIFDDRCLGLKIRPECWRGES